MTIFPCSYCCCNGNNSIKNKARKLYQVVSVVNKKLLRRFLLRPERPMRNGIDEAEE